MEVDIEKIEQYINFLKQVESKTNKKIFHPKGLKYYEDIIASGKSQLKMKRYIDESVAKNIEKQFNVLEERLLSKIGNVQVPAFKDLTPQEKQEVVEKVEEVVDDLSDWIETEKTSEKTTMKHVNGHYISIFSSTDGQKIASVDGKENVEISNTEDLEKLKQKVEQMEKMD